MQRFTRKEFLLLALAFTGLPLGKPIKAYLQPKSVLSGAPAFGLGNKQFVRWMKKTDLKSALCAD